MNESSGSSDLPKVLFISPHLDPGERGGPALRTQQTVNTLSKLSNVDVFDLDRWPVSEGAWGKRGPLFRFFFDILNPTRTRMGQLLQIALGLWTSMCSNAVLEKIETTKPDLVWINFVSEHASLVWKIRFKHPKLVIIGDTDSVYSVFLRRTSSAMGFFRRLAYRALANRQAKREVRLSSDLDVFTAVSEIDKLHYESLGGSATVQLFANVIEVPIQFANIANRESNPTFLLPGSFGGPESAMTNGFNWFSNEVWPRILRSRPLAELVVVGRNAASAIAPTLVNRLTVASDVPEMGPFFEQAHVVICPLFFESGTRFKILEAAKYSVPVVSTSLGAEGLNFVDGTEIVIADDPETFANACLKLLDDCEYAKKIGAAARSRLESEYSQIASLNQARLIFEEAKKVSRNHK